MSDRQPCPTCGGELDRVECQTCGGEGLDGHDCGEDCCCCADPDEPNLVCGTCQGEGGWWSCPACHPEAFREMYGL